MAVSRRVALALALALGGAPTGGQVATDAADAPRSLLPDTFGPAVAPPVDAAPPLAVAPPPAAAPPAAEATPLPEPAGPSIELVGPLTPELGGLGGSAFAGADGRFVDGLLRRLTTPIASRWGHILLRRALLTRAAVPAGASPGDWVADRARVLLGLGEVDGAEALTDDLPVDRMTPRLVRVAGQVSLAAGDVPGLCPLADVGGGVSPDPLWRLAAAMCAALAGDDIGSAGGFDTLRGDGQAVDAFDVQLGERIATASLGNGRAANLDWDSVARVTPFRFGVAAAAGVAVPLPRLVELAAATGGTSWGWVLHSPAQTPEARAAALRPAAVLGIASAEDVVAAVAAASADLDRSALDASPAGTLRDAYAGATTAARMTALRKIWSDANGTDERYAALIESGVAAARLPVDRTLAGDADTLVAAMLAVGIEDRAARWWPVIADRDDAAGRNAWALLAVGANGGIQLSPGRFQAWATATTPHRAALLLAALDGFGAARGPAWDTLRGNLGLHPTVNGWTRAIDAAGAARRSGEVAVLAATGLQTRWATVPPSHLAHIVAALVAAGRGHEARMIAAEAVTRG